MQTILVVDDSATSRLLFRAYMPKEGDYLIYEAQDAESALEKAAEVKPDIVVLDYSMPGKNGVEIAELLKAQGLEAKFVLLTANTQQGVIEAAKAAGISEILEKPIQAEKIVSIL